MFIFESKSTLQIASFNLSKVLLAIIIPYRMQRNFHIISRIISPAGGFSAGWF
jgi:hypothetical protein